jgi:hypothetical protein
MKFTLALFFLAATAIARPAAENAELVSDTDGDSPDPRQVYIESLISGGTGCPQGTVGKSISNDRQTFTLIFDNFVASIGPGIPVTENRKACQLNIKLRYPPGWSYAIMSSDYRGFVSADRGVTAAHKSLYYFAGQTQQISTASNFVGPVSKDYVASDRVGTIAWAPCGLSANLNIKGAVELRANNSNARGQMTQDSHDGKVTQILRFQWRRC